jgi:hypothetical protein
MTSVLQYERGLKVNIFLAANDPSAYDPISLGILEFIFIFEL